MPGCSCSGVPGVPCEGSLDVPMWPYAGMGVPIRAGCLRGVPFPPSPPFVPVPLQLLQDHVPQCVPSAVPIGRRGGQNPVPTLQGITRGSARLCLILGITWAGLGRGGHRGCPPQGHGMWQLGTAQGGVPPAAPARFTVCPSTSHGGVWGLREVTELARRLRFIGVRGQAVPVPCCMRRRSSSSCSDSSVSFLPILSCTSRYLATHRSRHTLSPFDSSASL